MRHLLAPPPRKPPGAAEGGRVLMTATTVCALEAVHDVHKLPELADPRETHELPSGCCPLAAVSVRLWHAS